MAADHRVFPAEIGCAKRSIIMSAYAQFLADYGINGFRMALIVLALVIAHRIVASMKG